MSTNHNPMQTDGFDFVKFTGPDSQYLVKLFEQMGFKKVAKHRYRHISLYRQGHINFWLECADEGFAKDFADKHGPSACAMGFRVKDAAFAYKRAKELGAKIIDIPHASGEYYMPAIEGIGGSRLYFIDGHHEDALYKQNFEFIPDVDHHPKGVGLLLIDHLTHNVHQGQMKKWADFYETHFNFREIRYFDIKGQHTGLTSRALTSPCGKIRIPINESSDDKSQIEEFLKDYKGEGIQHIALSTENIYQTVESLHERGTQFMDVPDTYYRMLEDRLPKHGEDIERLRKNRLLVDGEVTPDHKSSFKLLLQIFTKPVIGPIFFEIIQRKGNEGFGEGNFQALFESIERDQIERGVLQA